MNKTLFRVESGEKTTDINLFDNMDKCLTLRDDLRDAGIPCIIDPDRDDWVVSIKNEDVEGGIATKDLLQCLERINEESL